MAQNGTEGQGPSAACGAWYQKTSCFQQAQLCFESCQGPTQHNTDDDGSAARDITVDLARALSVAPTQAFAARDLWKRAEHEPGSPPPMGNWTLEMVPAFDTMLLRLSAL